MRVARLLVLAAVSTVALTGCLFGGGVSANVGDCLNVSDLGIEVDNLPKTDCNDPHEAEVFATFDLDHSGLYVESSAYDAAIVQCETYFADYVGIDYQQSEILIDALIPTTESWNNGDKEIICLLMEVDWDLFELKLVEGSVKGAAR